MDRYAPLVCAVAARVLPGRPQEWEEVTSDGMGDYEVERAVYRWLTANVAYDWDHQSFFHTQA